MIQMGTYLKVADNSGGRWVKCIKVLGKSNKKIATVGDLILITVNKMKSQKKIKKRTVYMGLIISVANWIRRQDGTLIRFFFNKVLIFTKQYKFLGTRVYGILAKEVRNCKNIEKKEKRYFQKVVSYCSASI